MKTEIGNVKTIRTIDPTVARTSMKPPLCPSASKRELEIVKSIYGRYSHLNSINMIRNLQKRRFAGDSIKKEAINLRISTQQSHPNESFVKHSAMLSTQKSIEAQCDKREFVEPTWKVFMLKSN